MRIIDKNTDYYDYLQDREDTLVFDRRGSVLVNKTDIYDVISHRDNDLYTFMLLQCGASYWLFIANATKYSKVNGITKVTECDIELIASWKDYTKEYQLLEFEAISIHSLWQYSLTDYNWRKSERKLIMSKVHTHAEDLKNAIIHKDYEPIYFFNKKIAFREFDKKTGKINWGVNTTFYPLLKACGISTLIDAETMYHAIDEYFSLMKTAAESTVAEGTTNNDKIKNHGFDTKTSFRGKTK